MVDDVVIRIEGLWKKYGLPLPVSLGRLLGRPPGKGTTRAAGTKQGRGTSYWALQDVAMEIRAGETIGIIGRNGAGKSTLLKVLAGVSPPTHGRVKLRGEIFPMIELNAGLHMELTGRENVRLLGAIMGMRSDDVARKMDDIADFCELDAWFDRPVRKYSTGMVARLGFAVAMNVEAQILLIDEVLAVGDLTFQAKCFERLEAMRASGVTILLVSHNLRQIDRLCDRVAFLQAGRCLHIGETEKVVQAYYNESRKSITRHLEEVHKDSKSSIENISVTEIEFLDEDGRSLETVQMFSSLVIRIRYFAHRPILRPDFVIGILSPEMFEITNFNTANVEGPELIEGSGYVDCQISEIVLLPGNYGIKCVIRDYRGLKHFRKEQATWFQVVSKTYRELRGNSGFVFTPVRWRFSPKKY